MEYQQFSSRQWWWLKITIFNKGLLVSGLIAFMIYCALGASIINIIKEYNLVLWAVLTFMVFYIIYMVLANMLYAFGWLIDEALNDKESESFRLQLFSFIYWLAVAVPVLAMCFIVYVFIKTPNSLF